MRLKKWEAKHSMLMKEIKEMKEAKHPNLTGIQIWQKFTKLRTKKWRTRFHIRRLKELIGFQQNITNIIISSISNII